MSDFAFKVTSGPYEGRYDIEAQDFTATEMMHFRQAVGVSLESVFAGAESPGLYVLAGMVWLLRRRNAKALPFTQVADTITLRNIEGADATEEVKDSPEA